MERRTPKQIEKILDNATITLDLDYVIQLMKVLELAENFLESNTEQWELVSEYAEELYEMINDHLSDDDFILAEENGMLNEL